MVKIPQRRRSGKAPKAPVLTFLQAGQLDTRVRRVVCSEPWRDVCYSAVLSGVVTFKDQQAKELRRVGLYPPGGLLSLMKRCRRCRREIPPQCIGSSGHCDECRYEGMSDEQIEGLPPSPGCLIDMVSLAADRRRAGSVHQSP